MTSAPQSVTPLPRYSASPGTWRAASQPDARRAAATKRVATSVSGAGELRRDGRGGGIILGLGEYRSSRRRGLRRGWGGGGVGVEKGVDFLAA